MSKHDVLDPVGQALTLAARRHRTRTALRLQEIGLFPGQEQVLRLLSLDDGRTMSALADALSIRPPTASKMIARLAAQGLVERKPNAVDARIVSVHLTADGRARAATLDTIAAQIEAEVLKGLDGKDEKRLRKLLRKIAKNLTAVQSETEAGEDVFEDAL